MSLNPQRLTVSLPGSYSCLTPTKIYSKRAKTREKKHNFELYKLSYIIIIVPYTVWPKVCAYPNMTHTVNVIAENFKTKGERSVQTSHFFNIKLGKSFSYRLNPVHRGLVTFNRKGSPPSYCHKNGRHKHMDIVPIGRIPATVLKSRTEIGKLKQQMLHTGLRYLFNNK